MERKMNQSKEGGGEGPMEIDDLNCAVGDQENQQMEGPAVEEALGIPENMKSPTDRKA